MTANRRSALLVVLGSLAGLGAVLALYAAYRCVVATSAQLPWAILVLATCLVVTVGSASMFRAVRHVEVKDR